MLITVASQLIIVRVVIVLILPRASEDVEMFSNVQHSEKFSLD